MPRPDAKLIEALESDARFHGKRIRDVPELAAVRTKHRRNAYRVANFGIGLTLFNFVLATAPEYPLWWLSAVSAGVGAWTVWRMELLARIMSRQLNRPAAEQVARDLMGIFD